MTHRYTALAGGRMKLRLPMSPLRAEMALRALEEWRQPEDTARERHWYRIANQAEDAPTQVNIYDEISWWGISAQEFVDDISAITGDLEVHINSPGGDAFDGITIFNALRGRAGKVGVVVDGLAASAASVIAMGATPGMLSMAPGSMMMIHDALALCIGNEADMLEMAGVLGKVSGNIASVYADRTGTPATEWRATMVGDAWYTAQEAVDAGLADQLAARPGTGDEPAAAPEAAWSRTIFAAWQGRPKAADGDGGGGGGGGGEEGCGCCGECTGPGCGCCPECTPDGGGTCEACGGSGRARGDSGQFTGPCPDCQPAGDGGVGDRAPAVRNEALAVHHTATVDEPWDGPAAVAAMPNDATVLRYCHAWEDSAADDGTADDPDGDADDKKSSYKFPHHKTKGGPANLAACRNGLARLSGADIPDSDRGGVKSHLQAHLDDGDKGADDHVHTGISAVDAVERYRAALKGARA